LIPQGTLPWQPVKSKNRRFFGPIYFVALPFENGWRYRNFDFKRLNRMNFSALCTILVAFSLESSEFTLLTIAPFSAIRQKSAYYTKYLRISWTYLDLLYRFGRRISGDDDPNIRLAVAQETLLWQPVKFGRCSQTSRGTTFTVASVWRFFCVCCCDGIFYVCDRFVSRCLLSVESEPHLLLSVRSCLSIYYLARSANLPTGLYILAS